MIDQDTTIIREGSILNTSEGGSPVLSVVVGPQLGEYSSAWTYNS